MLSRAFCLSAITVRSPRCTLGKMLLLALIFLVVRVHGLNNCQGDWSEEYAIQKDDCLSQIAKAYGVGVQNILNHNRQIGNVNYIEVNWILCLPAGRRRREPMKCVAGTTVDEQSESQARKPAKQQRPRFPKPTEAPVKQNDAAFNNNDNIPPPNSNFVTTPVREGSKPAVPNKQDDTQKNPSELPNQNVDSVSGTIDPNIVQCQYFDNGLANCWKVCTADEFEYAVDTTSDSTITMRQCIENQAPAVHTWDVGDGILANWLSPRLIKAGGKERIVAACTFWRNRTFSCVESTMCSQTKKPPTNPTCQGGRRWSGKATEGDPLRDESVLKGTIQEIPAQRGGRNRRSKPSAAMNIDAANTAVNSKKITQEFIQSDNDPDTIQCTYFNDLHAECDDECSYDPVIWDIAPEQNMKIMKRECNKTRITVFSWTPQDGILAEGVLPSSQSRPSHDISAICTFSKSGPIFECSGIAICDPKRVSGFDQCSGGLPWRGKKNGDGPLSGIAPTGTIQSFAQNASPQAPMQTEPVEAASAGSKSAATNQNAQNTNRNAGKKANRATTLAVLEDSTTAASSEDNIGSPGSRQPLNTQSQGLRTVQCGERVKSCVFAKHEETTERDTCFQYATSRVPRSEDSAAAIFAVLQGNIRSALETFAQGHAECLVLGGNQFCKIYNASTCQKNGGEGPQKIVDCGLQSVSFSAEGSTAQECDDLGVFHAERYKSTCTILKGWDADTWDRTCYNPTASDSSLDFRVRRSSNVDKEISDILDEVLRTGAEFRDMKRVECDIFDKVASCTWYTESTCSGRWTDKSRAFVYHCHAKVYRMFPLPLRPS